MLLFRALASGSSGNAFLLRTAKVNLLFDAGLRLPRLRQALTAEDIGPGDLTAVFVSHEHTDHCSGVRDLINEFAVPAWSNEQVLRAAGLTGTKEAAILPVGKPVLFGDVEVVTFPVSHDAVCPVGFMIRVADKTIAIATDTGEATDAMSEAISHADLAVLEANHDLDMLLRGRYPQHLRRRVSSATGHLSNGQAGGILAGRVKDQDVEVWLAHLSKENNTPVLALETVRRSLNAVGLGSLAVGVLRRDRPSLRWTGIPRPRQLSLFPAETA